MSKIPGKRQIFLKLLISVNEDKNTGKTSKLKKFSVSNLEIGLMTFARGQMKVFDSDVRCTLERGLVTFTGIRGVGFSIGLSIIIIPKVPLSSSCLSMGLDGSKH